MLFYFHLLVPAISSRGTNLKKGGVHKQTWSPGNFSHLPETCFFFISMYPYCKSIIRSCNCGKLGNYKEHTEEH